MSIRLIPEVLALCSACKTPAELIQTLRANASPAFKTILQYAFYPNVEWDVKIPQWKPDPNPLGTSPNSLFMEARRLYIFTKAKDLSQEKKTELLLTILESVHPSEAQMLVDLIEHKDLGVKLLTYNVVREAFPEILPLTD